VTPRVWPGRGLLGYVCLSFSSFCTIPCNSWLSPCL
jgi:hypothetical protein